MMKAGSETDPFFCGWNDRRVTLRGEARISVDEREWSKVGHEARPDGTIPRCPVSHHELCLIQLTGQSVVISVIYQ